MKKVYYIQENIGNVKYVVNFSDGVKTHPDGSPFCDIRTFSNKRLMNVFIRQLENEGYVNINGTIQSLKDTLFVMGLIN